LKRPPTSPVSPQCRVFSFGAKLGFISWGAEVSVDFSMDIETKTSMKYSLGWKYNLPECKTGSPCTAHVDVNPYLFVPNGDASGYNAPWISLDVRNYQKPKPGASPISLISLIPPALVPLM